MVTSLCIHAIEERYRKDAEQYQLYEYWEYTIDGGRYGYDLYVVLETDKEGDPPSRPIRLWEWDMTGELILYKTVYVEFDMQAVLQDSDAVRVAAGDTDGAYLLNMLCEGLPTIDDDFIGIVKMIDCPSANLEKVLPFLERHKGKFALTGHW